MAYFSLQESDSVNPNFHRTSQNKYESICDAGDCILNGFLGFSHSSPETQSDNVCSLDISDLWDKNRYKTLQTTECKSSMDDGISANSCGSFLNDFSIDSLSEEINYTNTDFPSCEIPMYDDFESFAVNTSTVDVLDYLEESESLINNVDKSNNFCKRDVFISRGEYFGEVGNTIETIDKSFCSNQSCAEWLLPAGCATWSTKIHTDLIPCTTAPSNMFQEPYVLDNKVNEDTKETNVCYNEACNTLSQLDQHLLYSNTKSSSYSGAPMLFQEVKGKLNTKYTAGIVPNIVAGHSAEKETVSLCNLSSLQTAVVDESEVRQNKTTEDLSRMVAGPTPALNFQLLKMKNVQPVNQRKEAKPAFITQTTSQHLQIPYFSEIGNDWKNLRNKNHNIKTTVPLSNTQTSENAIIKCFLHQKNTFTMQTKSLEDTDTTTLYKSKPADSNNLSFSHVQNNRPQDNMDRTASKKPKYLKIGKKGRFVTLPTEKVNKLMVRDLLTMSGNKEEMSIKEKTQEYRKNIYKMMQQKRKRLNLI